MELSQLASDYVAKHTYGGLISTNQAGRKQVAAYCREALGIVAPNWTSECAALRSAIEAAIAEQKRRWLAEEDARRAAREASPEWQARRAEERRIAAEEAAAEAAVRAERRRLQAALRRMGFRLRRSEGGSNYYENAPAGLTVRLSDHEVPETEARWQAMQAGGHSWCNSSLSFVVGRGADAEAWLAYIASEVAR